MSIRVCVAVLWILLPGTWLLGSTHEHARLVSVVLDVPMYGSVITEGIFGLTRATVPFALSHDGRYLVSFSQEGVLTIWRTTSGAVYRTLPVKIPEFDKRTFGAIRLVGISQHPGTGPFCVAVDRYHGEVGVYIYTQDGEVKGKLPNEHNKTLEGAIALGSRYVAYASMKNLLVFSLRIVN